MRTRIAVVAVLTTACLTAAVLNADQPTSTAAPDVVFARDIQPLLAKHCLLCHGPDEAEAGLRLDIAEQAVAKLESGARAIAPGNARASELLQRVVSTDDSLRMPPEGDPLDARQVALLRRWIEQGATYQRHWAYQPVKKPELPRVNNAAWVRSPIDRFVLARLEQSGVSPSAEADRATLIKRLYYDLIGLPPEPAVVDACAAETSPRAYESLVDRLLESAHFGERWGRRWLDKARYADSDGYEKDRPRPNAWRYRDWVIDAVNQDMPFDQFTVEQLAGDLLADPTPRQRLATAFHRQTLTNTEGGTDQEQFRVEATFDRTETTSAIWMALTMTCARCHSHKYDQISQREYYQLFAFFNNANEANYDVPRSEEAFARYLEQKTAHDAKIAQLENEYSAARSELQPQIEAWSKRMSAEFAEQASPVAFADVKLIDAKAESRATLMVQKDHSLLVTGNEADKDKYSLVFAMPELPLTGIQLELLTHDSLARKGPGRAPNGNFVLSEVRAFVSDDQEFGESEPIEFASAEADFAQDKFAAESVLSSKERTGWAVAPRMGKPHHLTVFTSRPYESRSGKFVQVVLDQQYGGKHTIGCVRIKTMTGFDPLRALPKEVADALRTEAGKRTAEQRRRMADHFATTQPKTAKLASRLAALKKNSPMPPVMTVRVLASAQRVTKVLSRGDFLQPEDEVGRDGLEVIRHLHPLESRTKGGSPDRLDLARWLVSERHPLTPRVAVNHVWSHLFGRGIVPTLSDFGVRGERPTHPELLDWLAWRFPRGMHWSRKALIKAIVMSATYRQSSKHRQELRDIDPENRLLARQNRVRVEAEIVRDLYLTASGLLSEKVGGPSVFPPLPAGVANLSYANNFKWATSKGEDRYRRGMYTFFKRTAPHPNLISFDCPDSNTTKLQRDSSNTPLQALVTLNNEVFTEAARAMANRVLTEAGDDDTKRLNYALRLCIVRVPNSQEVARFQRLLDAARGYYNSHADDAAKAVGSHAAKGVASEENAAWVATLRMVMNLDEFIVRD